MTRSREAWSQWAEKRLSRATADASFDRDMAAQTKKRFPPLTVSYAGNMVYPVVQLCLAAGLPEPIPEYQFAKPRLYRADYCWPVQKLILEIDGGAWLPGGGRHNRGAGFLADMERANLAAVLGFRMLRYPPDKLGNAVDDLKAIFEA